MGITLSAGSAHLGAANDMSGTVGLSAADGAMCRTGVAFMGCTLLANFATLNEVALTPATDDIVDNFPSILNSLARIGTMRNQIEKNENNF